jgi:predicted unusual protein kinase regulating ubiquinone biosynthesis (AarF/ABC1/UbiB family)
MSGGERRESRVPRTRAERLGRLGSLVAEIAGDVAREQVSLAVRRGAQEGGVLLNAARAERLGATLAELRGAALKLGQLVSLQGEDLMPAELVSALARLRDQADAMPQADVERTLGAELGASWTERFREFDWEPIAAASIGQVHAAESADGRDLAVKIQYPGVAESIEGDVRSLIAILRMTRLLPRGLDADALARELADALAREADYESEAESTLRYRSLLDGDTRFHVPRAHPDLSTRRVLALDRVWGLPIEDLRGAEHSASRRDELAGALVGLVLRELFEFHFMQTDPNFGNYLYEPKDGRVALLDFGAAQEISEEFADVYRGLVRAACEGEAGDVLEGGQRAGFLTGEEGGRGREAFLAIARLFAEPLRTRGPYDFAASDLGVRLRQRSVEAYRNEWLPRPPVRTLMLHRKLAGSFLLCAHLGARVDCHALYRAHLRD